MLEAPRDDSGGDKDKKKKDNRRLTWCPGKAKAPTHKSNEQPTVGANAVGIPLCFFMLALSLEATAADMAPAVPFSC